AFHFPASCRTLRLRSFPPRRSSDLPAACRRVGLPVWQAVMHAIVPAVWPAVVAAGFLWVVRPYVPANLPGVALASIVAGLLYLRSEEHTSELQSRENLVCRLLLEKK